MRKISLLIAIAGACGSAAANEPVRSLYAGDTARGGIFNRMNADCSALSLEGTAVRHQTRTFRVTRSGTYTIASRQTGFDGFLHVYRSPFNPATPSANCIEGNDDGDDLRSSGLSLALDAGVLYTIVTSSWTNGEAGRYTNSIAGVGAIEIGPVPDTDFDGDGTADLLWSNPAAGRTYFQHRNGPATIREGDFLVNRDWQVIASGDLNADGRNDLLWHNRTSGESYYWLIGPDGTSPQQQGSLLVHPTWRIQTVADLDADGHADLVWYNSQSGETYAWRITLAGNRPVAQSADRASLYVDPNWRVTATGDLNADGRSDLLWFNPQTGQSVYWLMNGLTRLSAGVLFTSVDWRIVATGDVNGDRRVDLIWHNQREGHTYLWLMDPTGVQRGEHGTLLLHPEWRVTGAGDVDADGDADLFWRNGRTGETYLWLMQNARPISQGSLSTDPGWILLND
jgi:hypothetical protein